MMWEDLALGAVVRGLILLIVGWVIANLARRAINALSAETLSARVHKGEHIILPMAVGWFCERRLRLREFRKRRLAP